MTTPNAPFGVHHRSEQQHFARLELIRPVRRVLAHLCAFLVGHIFGKRRSRKRHPHIELLRFCLRRGRSRSGLSMRHHRRAKRHYNQRCAQEPRAKSRADHVQQSSSSVAAVG
jgi:hypothetical protein